MMNVSFTRFAWTLLIAILPIAFLSDTSQAQSVANARNESGHVFVDGSWQTPEVIAGDNLGNKNLEEYVLIREQAPDTEEGQILLARSVTALEVILAQVNEPVALQSVAAIDKFSEREATESLARIALLNPSDAVPDHTRLSRQCIVSIRLVPAEYGTGLRSTI